MRAQFAKNYVDISNFGKCPHCNVAIDPIPLHGHLEDRGHQTLQEGYLLARCTEPNCKRVFMAVYRGHTPSAFTMKDLYPKNPPQEEFPDCIKTISPSFVEIYNQAIAAECADLHHLAGMGYRKALEFLVKDYAILQKPEARDAIENAALGNCIKHHIAGARITECAERALWLGNAQSHFKSIYPPETIEHMKDLIRLVTKWIDDQETQRAYLKKYPEKNVIAEEA